jgi:aspartyl-tRNA(Asn)/glutamyl-tRNA(Gln) amidotransferase subunit A
MFDQADCLIMPTTPSTAFKIGEVKDPITMYLQDIYTVHANLTGNPAISLPYTFHTNGLPFGVQLMTDNFNESLLFHASAIVKNSMV